MWPSGKVKVSSPRGAGFRDGAETTGAGVDADGKVSAAVRSAEVLAGTFEPAAGAVCGCGPQPASRRVTASPAVVTVGKNPVRFEIMVCNPQYV